MLALDHTRLAQHFRRDRSLAQRRQLLQVHDVEFLAENVGKSALGPAAMQGHLAAFKAAHHARAAARTLAFVSAGGGLAHARAHAAADTLLVLRRLLWCANIGMIHK